VRLVFSKDRAAQLDLLLRSLERYAPKEHTRVIVAASTPDFASSYDILASAHPWVTLHPEYGDWDFDEECDFGARLTDILDYADDMVTFFCDDNVLYREIDRTARYWLRFPEVLTHSLRLGSGVPTWDWTKLESHDHGYPGSIDGHTFRTDDLRRMLDGQEIPDPLILETILAKRAGELGRPLMASYREQKLVGVDVNTVAEQVGRPSGKRHPQSAEELNARYLAGERISLDALDFSGVDGCLAEVPFVWERAA
jgi:hypothetical protein